MTEDSSKKWKSISLRAGNILFSDAHGDKILDLKSRKYDPITLSLLKLHSQHDPFLIWWVDLWLCGKQGVKSGNLNNTKSTNSMRWMWNRKEKLEDWRSCNILELQSRQSRGIAKSWWISKCRFKRCVKVTKANHVRMEYVNIEHWNSVLYIP